MRSAALLLLMVACGGGQKQLPNARLTARDEIIRAVGNAGALAKLMQGSVVNGGLWFDDEGCKKQFPVGEIRDDRMTAFAECLAKIPFRVSSREDTLGDVTVLTYDPGFEIEVRVISTEHGSRLTWLGYASRRDADTLPSITGEALESHRLSGDRDGPLGAEAASLLEAERQQPVVTAQGKELPKRTASFAWLKVCLDPTGAVTSADPFLVTSSLAEKVFSQVAKTWTFRPFVVRGTPIPVCALVRPSSPPRSPEPERLPLPPPPSHGRSPLMLADGASLVEGHRIAGTRVILPNDMDRQLMSEKGVHKVVGVFRLCLDDKGAVESVLPMQSTGLGGYDQRLLEGMRQWRYSPYMVDGQAVPICTGITFVYSQDAGPRIVRPMRR